jgi:methylated-DNA-[protein]-cysteine S-methyltransferase
MKSSFQIPTIKNFYCYDTVIGKIGIGIEGNCLTNVFFMHRLLEIGDKNWIETETETTQNIANQIRAYLQGERKIFNINILLHGTEFQKKVWNELLKIPYGETRSYGNVARAIGVPNGARAVGMANNKNPISMIIPCHRVIGASGNLVGYGGGLGLKQKLLTLEMKYKVCDDAQNCHQ